MSPYVSGEEAGQQGQILALHDALQVLLNDLKSNFPLMGGQLEGLGNNLRSQMRMMQESGDQASLHGKGPRAAILRAVYRGECAEQMIAAELPIKRGDSSTDEYRKQLMPAAVADRFLAKMQLGDTSTGYWRWSFDRNCEDLGTLFTGNGIGYAFSANPATIREGVHRGRIGETSYYGGTEHHTLVVRYKPEDGTKNEALVFIGSIHYGTQYLVYVPLEDTWVLTNDSQFVDIPTVNHRIVELMQEHGLFLPDLSLENAFNQIWAEAERLELTAEPSDSVWKAPTDWNDKRSWPKAEFHYARTGHVGHGHWDMLQLALRRDIFCLQRYTSVREDGTTQHRFECQTQSLRGGDWERISLRIRHDLVAEYMTALAVAAAEMATAQLIDQPATAEAEA